MSADAAISSRSNRLPATLLALLLLLLAFRLTCSETLRETLIQKSARLEAALHPSPDNTVGPFIGPMWTAGYCALALLLAGGAAFVAARRGALRRGSVWLLALMAVVVALLVLSSVHAADRFSAFVGTADIATALLGAWAGAVLCDAALLGQRGRNAVFAAVVAILAVTVGKALMQHFVEYPDMAQYVHEHMEEALRKAGISDDPVQRTLFMGRLNSAEVSGFGALSNVFATQMIALLAVLAAILVAAFSPLLELLSGARAEGKETAKAGGDIPIEGVAFGGLCAVLPAAFAALVMTQSKGGVTCGTLALLAVGLGAIRRNWIIAHWRAILLTAAGAAILGIAAVLAYGITHHRLPTKSLLFRWQYWTATAPMIEQSPALGVGLNNFGDYYLRYKSPASPEDVKDPHNFFVRLAAEAGIPATLLVGGLFLWLLLGALRRPEPEPKSKIKNQNSKIASTLLFAALIAIVLIPLHLLSEGDDAFTLCMTIIYATAGWAVFAAALILLDFVAAVPGQPVASPLSLRFIALAGIAAAVFMLLYDQVNMALVTGPVAMLFWLLLALGVAAAPAVGKPVGKLPALAAGAFQLAVGAALAALVVTAVAGASLPDDPAPYEMAYVRSLYESHDDAAALAALNQAIALAPNNGELLMQRIVLKRDHLHQPVADDIRQMLALDRANAGIRLQLALPDSGLPASERIAALEDALRFDQALAPDEPKRLTAKQIEQVKQTIARLALTTRQ